jgi:hypothetical protein
MPYTYVEAPVYVEDAGIQVRHVFRDDIVDGPPLIFWYQIGGEEFDIRDLPVGSHAARNAGGDHHRQLLRQAIQLRLLTEAGVDWDAVPPGEGGSRVG